MGTRILASYDYADNNGLLVKQTYGNGHTVNYTYDADGLRTGRTDGTNTYQYIYAGDKLVRMIYNGEVVDISYAGSQPLSLTYDGATYYYVLNGQGDVIGLTDSTGTMAIGYTYGAYGTIMALAADENLAPVLVQMNPLTYRGYVYDRETALYYLQSRYYDPEIGRFINADAYASTGQGILGNNMFAYCLNNPVNNADLAGESGILTALAIAGIAVSAIVGAVVAGISAASSGGSTGEIIANAAIGAFSAGAIATVAALGAMGTLSVGTVGLISGGIGATGEIASIAVEHAYHKNDENYTFDLASATTKVIYAGGISAFSGCISYGLNGLYTGADEMIGVCISGETAVTIGLVDFGVRKLISVATGSSDTNTLPPIGGTLGAKRNIAFGY